MISFLVPGLPIAKGRAKVSTFNGRIQLRTPERTVRYESTVALFARQAMGDRNLFDCAVSLSLVLHMPIPASWSKKKQAMALIGSVWPTSKPDCSNVLKAVEDAMNGIVYLDDKQIVMLSVRKIYSQYPHVDVVVEALA